MPTHEVHDKYDMQVFGVPFGTYHWVHQLMDSPFSQIFGKQHRKILHDAEGVEAIRQQFGDMIALVAMHHITLDFPRTYVIQNGQLIKLKRVHKKHKKHVHKKNL